MIKQTTQSQIDVTRLNNSAAAVEVFFSIHARDAAASCWGSVRSLLTDCLHWISEKRLSSWKTPPTHDN